MSGQTEPYVRVYYAVINDPKFEHVFPHDSRLATWLRLLLVADALYPASAPIPQGTKRAALDALIECGLVEPVGSNQFRICGLAAERERRSAAGRAGASGRWHRNAFALPPQSDGNAQEFDGALLAETSRDKPRQAETSSPQTPRRGARDRSRREAGMGPRQLREGSPSIDGRALTRLADLLPRREEGA